ncbi:Rubrerythrin [Caldithrix abyssi DSM 13497]|uniref:Rubrerythrin n=1 Tax=Caldithrix abyssi DSM 13497 TaxID=880073 RepID=H1XQM2_CALAY|nr:ferritin family protein [Caldithrix abyssi]APF17014.1 Rubrerythrin [Caldithrix abyssi DSM 13497]EHO41168.1 Rubrerythrin [Caldithrix abyssi DSM 13497]
MSEFPKTLEEILKKSIQLEEEGFKFYNESAQKIKNSVGKRMLERLANDEKNHVARFKQLYEAVTNNSVDQVKFSEREPTTFEMIFNRLKDQLEGAVEELGEKGVDDQEIIEMAMDLENTTRFFYKEAAQKAKDEKIKNFYELLAKEEDAHYEVLQKALQFLEDPSLFFGMGDSRL